MLHLFSSLLDCGTLHRCLVVAWDWKEEGMCTSADRVDDRLTDKYESHFMLNRFQKKRRYKIS